MKTLYEKMERGDRGIRADYSPKHEGAFVELLNKEIDFATAGSVEIATYLTFRLHCFLLCFQIDFPRKKDLTFLC